MRVSTGAVEEDNVVKKLQKQEAEEKRLSVMMIPKKKKRLYDKIMTSKKKRRQTVCSSAHLPQVQSLNLAFRVDVCSFYHPQARKLEEKRAKFDEEQKKMRKKAAKGKAK